jgi:hypothetical protein
MSDTTLVESAELASAPLSVKTASRRLGITQHRVKSLLRAGLLVAADPPTFAQPSGPGRRASLFLTPASVSAQRARVLAELGASEPCACGAQIADTDEREG